MIPVPANPDWSSISAVLRNSCHFFESSEIRLGPVASKLTAVPVPMICCPVRIKTEELAKSKDSGMEIFRITALIVIGPFAHSSLRLYELQVRRNDFLFILNEF